MGPVYFFRTDRLYIDRRIAVFIAIHLVPTE